MSDIYIFLKIYTQRHRRTGPVSFRGAEVSFPNILSIACPENQVVLPKYKKKIGLKMAIWKILGGLQPPPRTASYAYAQRPIKDKCW